MGRKYGWNVGTQGATDAEVDFSGSVALSDLVIVGKHYGKSSTVNYTWLPYSLDFKCRPDCILLTEVRSVIEVEFTKSGYPD